MIYLVGVLLNEGAKSKAELFVPSDGPVHGVDFPWRLVLVDLLALLRASSSSTAVITGDRHSLGE